MLYVGFLEAPLRHAKQLGMFALFATFLVLSLLGSVLSLRWARSVFKPIERMNAVIQRVEQGDSAARVGELASRDEIGRLAGEFDHLLDTLATKQEELRRWADELDRKVMARTAELAETNASLGTGPATAGDEREARRDRRAHRGRGARDQQSGRSNPGQPRRVARVLGPSAAPVREEIRLIQQGRPDPPDRHQAAAVRTSSGVRRLCQTVDVNAVVDDCLVLTRHNLDKRGIRVETRLDAHAGVEINHSELQQVLISLIVNAVQAMPAGGRLTLLSEVWLEQGLQLGTVIHVRDTGRGSRAGPRPHLRPVLHHQARQRHRPGPVDQLYHRPALRRSHHGEQHARCGQRVLSGCAAARIRRQPSAPGFGRAGDAVAGRDGGGQPLG